MKPKSLEKRLNSYFLFFWAYFIVIYKTGCRSGSERRDGKSAGGNAVEALGFLLVHLVALPHSVQPARDGRKVAHNEVERSVPAVIVLTDAGGREESELLGATGRLQ